MKSFSIISLIFCFIVLIDTADSHYRHNHTSNNSKSHNINLTIEKVDILPFFVDLIKDLRKRGYPIKFVIDALKLVDQIEFTDFEDNDFSGTYNKVSNNIQLENSFIDQSTGKLKSYKKLKLIHVTTFYHELWHVYYTKYVKSKRPLFYYLYQKQMLDTFSGEIHANVIQNEAYGVFVGLAIQNYYQHYAILNYLGPDGRVRLFNGPKVGVMVDRYQEVLNYPVYGYYFNVLSWSVDDHDESLPQKDRDLIFKYVFKDEISQNFMDNFSEEVFNVDD